MNSEKCQDQMVQMMETGADEKVLRIFICSNVNQLFDMKVDLGGEPWLKKTAVKISHKYPRIYRLLCILKINKVYSRLVRGREQKNG